MIPGLSTGHVNKYTPNRCRPALNRQAPSGCALPNRNRRGSMRRQIIHLLAGALFATVSGLLSDHSHPDLTSPEG
jgi:hypothetical protein